MTARYGVVTLDPCQRLRVALEAGLEDDAVAVDDAPARHSIATDGKLALRVDHLPPRRELGPQMATVSQLVLA
jgi:hypothetical protein